MFDSIHWAIVSGVSSTSYTVCISFCGLADPYIALIRSKTDARSSFREVDTSLSPIEERPIAAASSILIAALISPFADSAMILRESSLHLRPSALQIYLSLGMIDRAGRARNWTCSACDLISGVTW
ncbi:MAG: hypothetical protein BWY93_02180 [Euryarchaeota archaeon ADurb.BinA087]|nr:MAG: hypothetical protein BWY93_02180 [Euryarchaeota archaeon ADurb.BinA087]